MNRDMRVIKEILEYVRDNADGKVPLNVPNGDQLKSKFSIEDHLIHYHVELCVQANFLKVEDIEEYSKDTYIPLFRILYLTWWGHEFLNSPPKGGGRGRKQSTSYPGMAYPPS